MRWLFTFACCLFIAGCSFHSSQLDTIRSITSPEEVRPEHYWQLDLGNRQMQLVAVVEQPPAVSFFHPDNLQINFDGWDITLVEGWPEGDTSIEINRENGIQVHELADGSRIELQCTDWVRTANYWELSCDSITGPDWNYTNRIDLNSSGQVTHLSFALWPGLSRLEMSWMPALTSDQLDR